MSDIPEFKCVETTMRGKREIYWGPLPSQFAGERDLKNRSVVINGEIRVIRDAEFLHKLKPVAGDYVGLSLYHKGESR